MPRMSCVVPAAALGFLAFLAGGFAVLYDFPPAAVMKSAQRGAEAAYDAAFSYNDPRLTDLYAPARRPETGVTVHDREAASQGYTLYLSPPGAGAKLIDMDGAVVHEWGLPYSAVWDDSSAVTAPRGDEFVYWRWAKLMPNGDLYALAAAAGATPWGYGLFKLDKDSNVVWKYLQQTHHDLTVTPDGGVVTLTHEVREAPFPSRPDIETPLIDDFVVALSPRGEELRKVSLLEALLRSPFAALIDQSPDWAKGDLLHANAAKPIGADQARLLPFAEAGQVLVSLRNIDTLAVLDLDAERIVWALRGGWIRQHDPDVLPNGDILLFDNFGAFGEGGRSRVVEIDPETGGVGWAYRGASDHPFQSDIRGNQQRLANGDTLIVESMGGRVFEVDRDGRIVWEFLNPSRAARPDAPEVDLVGGIPFAERMAPEDVDFPFNAGSRTARSE